MKKLIVGALLGAAVAHSVPKLVAAFTPRRIVIVDVRDCATAKTIAPMTDCKPGAPVVFNLNGDGSMTWGPLAP